MLRMKCVQLLVFHPNHNVDVRGSESNSIHDSFHNSAGCKFAMLVICWPRTDCRKAEYDRQNSRHDLILDAKKETRDKFSIATYSTFIFAAK